MINQSELEYLLFVAYLIVFAWLVTKTRFFVRTGLSKSQLVIIFLLKVIAGIFYGWMGIYYGGLAEMSDTWTYHYFGLMEYQLLQTHPHEYLTNLFHNPYPGGLTNFFGSSNSYWNDLKSNVIFKTISIFDIFSFGHYYVNVIFYSYISLFGSMAMYRVMLHAFPGRKLAILVATFFIPSFLYWSSGMHKEGLIFTGIALIVYHIYFGDVEGKMRLKRWLGILLGLIILLLLRNFVLVIMIPAILAWVLANRWPKYRLACFASVYLLFCILFFTLRCVDPRLNFPQTVVDKQQAFIQIAGNSSIPIKELKPTVMSFIKNIPQATTLSSIRPYPTDIRNLPSLIAAIETGFLLLLAMLSFFVRKKMAERPGNIIYFGVFFSFFLLLAIGFSVNNLGAIVRYRSIILPLLMIPVIVRIDWNRLFSIFSINTRKQGPPLK